MTDAKQGIYPNMPMSEYLALPALSSGLCHTILSASPLHAWTESWLNPNREREDSSKMDIGAFAHALLLERDDRALVVIEADDWRTKAAKEARDDARAHGLLPILAHKVPEVKAMVAVANEYIDGSEIAAIFNTGAAEQTIIFDVNGVPCKIRCDWLSANRELILSYKTTAGSANPDSWIRTQLPSYDAATVFYERGVETFCPDGQSPRCVHLVQEQQPPFGCSLVSLSPVWVDLASRKMQRAIDLWASCVATGRWPAYPSRICYADPAPWEEQRFLEQASSGDFLSDEDLKGGVPL